MLKKPLFAYDFDEEGDEVVITSFEYETGLEEHREVENAEGTSKFKCPCGSWMQHWKNHSSALNKNRTCSKYRCKSKATDGAHIKKTNGEKHYIVPLCHSCNMQTAPFKIIKSAELVSAAEMKSCGKVKNK